ncbi:MAG TPA: zinc ribbon domain-containing protein, partial [Thermoanaerobacterales bacterium]|jgi:hypothetical protein|nr:zinc ribbon domain-containing protein [Thermoanaerobacterales bacterium]
MPWCPKCRTEYRDGFTKCSDCGSELVNELEEINHEVVEYDHEAFLVSVMDEIEYSIIESKLFQSGIPIMKKYKGAGAYLSVFMGMTPFGIDIYVPSKSLKLAKELIMNDVYNLPKEHIDEALEDNYHKELNIRDKNKKIMTWIIILFFTPGLLWLVIKFIKALIY